MPHERRHADERRLGRTHNLFFFFFSSNRVAHTTYRRRSVQGVEGFYTRCTHTRPSHQFRARTFSLTDMGSHHDLRPGHATNGCMH
jgi:hypothetical protein